MIAHILLLPHEPTRAALLAPGAPVYDAGLRRFGWGVHDERLCYDDDSDDGAVDAYSCLVLARDGAVVPEGVDRIARVTGLSAAVIERALFLLWARGPLDDVVARTIAAVGTLLLLDAEGREVSGV
jgi:hypothetical protein